MKRPRWDKGGDGSAISNVGLLPSGCGKRSSKRGTAKLRKNCDAHTYKRRPVNSMDPLPPRRARFQSVSSLLFLSPFSSPSPLKRYVVHTRRRGRTVCMSQGACTCASIAADFCMKANEMARKLRQHNIEASWISKSIGIQIENGAPIFITNLYYKKLM